MTTDTVQIYAMRLHMPVAKFIELCNVNRATWWRWKTGRFQPRAATVAKIEATFQQLAKP